MRRIIATLVAAALLLGIGTSCVPSPYKEKENPNRPKGQQVLPPEQVPPDGAGQQEETPTETPTETPEGAGGE